MPTYLCHGFRWNRQSICVYITLDDIDMAHPEWIVHPDSAPAILHSFADIFSDILPPMSSVVTAAAAAAQPSDGPTTDNTDTHVDSDIDANAADAKAQDGDGVENTTVDATKTNNPNENVSDDQPSTQRRQTSQEASPTDPPIDKPSPAPTSSDVASTDRKPSSSTQPEGKPEAYETQESLSTDQQASEHRSLAEEPRASDIVGKVSPRDDPLDDDDLDDGNVSRSPSPTDIFPSDSESNDGGDAYEPEEVIDVDGQEAQLEALIDAQDREDDTSRRRSRLPHRHRRTESDSARVSASESETDTAPPAAKKNTPPGMAKPSLPTSIYAPYPWSPVQLLEEYDARDLTTLSRPFAFIVDYAVMVSTSTSIVAEQRYYETAIAPRLLSPLADGSLPPCTGARDETGGGQDDGGQDEGGQSDGGDEDKGEKGHTGTDQGDDEKSSGKSRKAGWLERMRDNLSPDCEIGWFVVVCDRVMKSDLTRAT